MTQHVIFLCWGNICRSPMAEFLARAQMPDDLDVEFTSAGVSDEERGGPIDPRAARTLAAHGFDVGPGSAVARHRAHLIRRDEAESADLVVAMAPDHVARLRRIAPQAHVELLTSFDPDATSDTVEDPWYGDQDGFETTYADICAALPGLFDALRGGDA